MERITLHASIKDMASHVAHQDNKFCMTGVIVERVGRTLYMVATNGTRMVMIESRCADDGDFRAIIPDHVIECLPVPREATTVELVRIIDETYELQHGISRVRFESIQGDPPPYREVVPAHDPADTASKIGINPLDIGRAMKFLYQFREREGMDLDPVVWNHGKPNKPITMAFAGRNHKATVVVMPVILNSEPTREVTGGAA